MEGTQGRKCGLPITRRKNNAQLSQQAKANLSNCFCWLNIISDLKEVYSRSDKKYFKFKLAFITLTLSDVQKHSDKFIKDNMLEPFLYWLRKYKNCKSYIWKAEVQNNGNIHFHITINKFVHWKNIRAKWNSLLAKNGYCKVYQDGTNDKGNAATEIKAVKTEKKLRQYIVGYFSKKDLFKKEWEQDKKIKRFSCSSSCELNGHYYMKQNFRQIQCSNGMVREYKREVEGRIWSASYNLNQTAILIGDNIPGYYSADYALNHEDLCDVEYFDWHKVHKYKKPIAKFLSVDIRNELKERIKQLKKDDNQQLYFEVESLN